MNIDRILSNESMDILEKFEWPSIQNSIEEKTSSIGQSLFSSDRPSTPSLTDSFQDALVYPTVDSNPMSLEKILSSESINYLFDNFDSPKSTRKVENPVTISPISPIQRSNSLDVLSELCATHPTQTESIYQTGQNQLQTATPIVVNYLPIIPTAPSQTSTTSPSHSKSDRESQNMTDIDRPWEQKKPPRIKRKKVDDAPKAPSNKRQKIQPSERIIPNTETLPSAAQRYAKTLEDGSLAIMNKINGILNGETSITGEDFVETFNFKGGIVEGPYKLVRRNGDACFIKTCHYTNDKREGPVKEEDHSTNTASTGTTLEYYYRNDCVQGPVTINLARTKAQVIFSNLPENNDPELFLFDIFAPIVHKLFHQPVESFESLEFNNSTLQFSFKLGDIEVSYKIPDVSARDKFLEKFLLADEELENVLCPMPPKLLG